MDKAYAAEDFKGSMKDESTQLGASIGLSVPGALAGPAANLIFAKRIMPEGLIADIHDETWLELDLGGSLPGGGTGVQFSLLGRWDFIKDASWTFSALGGLGGSWTRYEGVNSTLFYIRTGLAALYSFDPAWGLRLEVSHEFSGVGIVASF